MPELPDVESFRKYFNRTSLHKKIEKVNVNAKRMLKGISSTYLQKNRKNDKFKNREVEPRSDCKDLSYDE